jgi:hypothetical protein
MTAGREAIVLPMLFLTVALVGGLRIVATVRLVPPPLAALVLGVLLVSALVRAGALAPERLMHPSRSPLENVSGVVVLLTLFAASTQVFNLLTPEYGLLHVLFGVFFLVQLLTTLAGVTGRNSLLRSLVVLFASAFVLRFIVLDSLYAPDSGLMKRLLTTILEGISLGTIDYQANAATTGYVAFLAIVLYMIGLLLLPPAPMPRSRMRALSRTAPTDLVLVLIVSALALSGCETPGTRYSAVAGTERAARVRDDALRSARVWHPPAIPIRQVNFAENPVTPGGFRSTDDVSCRFVVDKIDGTSRKFNCELPGGEILKVKYGATNPELHAEVAATRLLGALGFGADRMFVVRTVRCAGCPRFPFHALRCAAGTGLDGLCFAGGLDYDRVRTIDPAVIERPLEGVKIESTDGSGWAWYELDRIDRSRGGSSRAEVDALRLLAIVLAHWDNKAPNQRLVCLPGGEGADGTCTKPFAMVHDLGATFGPLKLDFRNWSSTSVWADPQSCTVSMGSLPYHGATFPETRITEAGRLMLLGLLEQISESQLSDLFAGSRVISYDQISAAARGADAWVAAFLHKVRQIRDAGPCPGTEETGN